MNTGSFNNAAAETANVIPETPATCHCRHGNVMPDNWRVQGVDVREHSRLGANETAASLPVGGREFLPFGSAKIRA
jgi:hypothetical protein